MEKEWLLVPFEYKGNVVESIEVKIKHRSDKLESTFVILGQISEINFPSIEPNSSRVGGLWEDTCMELFIRPSLQQYYFEFNFSPSTHWQAYRFESYRESKTEVMLPTPKITTSTNVNSFVLKSEVEFNDQTLDERACFRPTAVVRRMDGQLEYWADRHRGDKPDFHLF